MVCGPVPFFVLGWKSRVGAGFGGGFAGQGPASRPVPRSRRAVGYLQRPPTRGAWFLTSPSIAATARAAGRAWVFPCAGGRGCAVSRRAGTGFFSTRVCRQGAWRSPAPCSVGHGDEARASASARQASIVPCCLVLVPEPFHLRQHGAEGARTETVASCIA